MTQRNISQKKDTGIIKIVIALGSSIIILLLGLSIYLKLPLPALLSKIKQSYYFPYVNSNTIGLIGNINLHVYVYALVFTTALLLYIWNLYNKKPSAQPVYQTLPHIGLLIFFIMAALQTFNHTKVFTHEFKIFGGKHLKEKQAFIHTTSYNFAVYCRELLPGQYKGKLLTSRDITREPYTGEHRALAYFLYPTIDIRGIHTNRRNHCIVVFHQKDFKNFIPKNSKIIGAFNQSCLLYSAGP